MDARAKRVTQDDLAIVSAAHTGNKSPIKQKMLAGTAADRHREIGKFLGGSDRHSGREW